MATITTCIGPSDHGRGMTLEEFRAAEGDPGYCYELIRGSLVVEDVPGEDHNQIICNLDRTIGRYRQSSHLILRTGGSGAFLLGLPRAVSALTPDFGVVLRGTPKDLGGHHIPSLVIEVATEDSAERDHILKRQDYLAFGLHEYWIVDLRTRRVTVLHRDGKVWSERTCVEAEALPSLVMPGFAARVDELWEGVGGR